MKRQYDARKRLPTERPGEFELSLPATHGAFEFIQRRMEKAGALVATPDEVDNRRVDDPVTGTVAIMHPDERVSKYGKPLVVYDYTPGQGPPTIYVSGGAMHAEEVVEKIREYRHYREDRIDRGDPDLARRNVKADHVDALDQFVRKVQGRRTYGKMTGGR
jgi:hypothetical protein